jgi:hypothetical protein
MQIISLPSRSVMNPPEFDSTIISHHRFRGKFASALASPTLITGTELLQSVLVALTATTTSAIYTAYRIRRVQMWGPPAADLVPVTVTLEFAPSIGGGAVGQRPRTYSDTSVGATEVAVVDQKPSPNSAAAMWQSNLGSGLTAGGALSVSGPANTVIDVVMDLVLQNGDPVLAGPAAVGATAGRIYGGKWAAGVIIPLGVIPLP